MNSYAYILANRKHGTIYIGHTANLSRRLYEHEQRIIEGFTSKYNVTRLVHIEVFDNIQNAQQRERNLKKWPRKWKVQLIEKENPEWDCLKHLLVP